MAVFWVVAPCSLVIALMTEAARTSETSVNFYQTTRRNNPEDSHHLCLINLLLFHLTTIFFQLQLFNFLGYEVLNGSVIYE
jgi:hypothetical protein